MIFRQLFDSISCTYTYLLASRTGGEALIIDPVLDNIDRYTQLLGELDLKLAKAVDTHVHADHITALGALRDRTRCVTVMGRRSQVDRVSMRVEEGDTIDIEGISLNVIHTPGHTDDSYCFSLPDRVFTGDTLLIRGTGRTDFQNGSPADAYNSIFIKLLTLPDETFVYPGHDYKGNTVSTIGEERAHNPRLQVKSADEYAEIMNNLDLPNPRLMDIAVPANLSIGFAQEDETLRKATVSATEAVSEIESPDTLFVDLREDSERAKAGVIAGSVHVPYQRLDEHIRPGGAFHAMIAQSAKKPLLYCAFGERSALALKAMGETGISNVRHLDGGIDGWIKAGGKVEFIKTKP